MGIGFANFSSPRVRPGAHAEFVAVPSSWLSEKPEGLSMEQAAVVGMPYLTAWLSLVEAGGLRRGEQLLITGASGAVGSAAMQNAHGRGELCWQPTPGKQRRIQRCF